jgi:hypothetical protein
MTLVTTDVSAQQKPTTGYAPVNGINMYYEVHGGGEPVVLLHGAFMTITNNWAGWISELSKARKVIAVEMQGGEIHGDLKPRSASRLAILPDTTHVTLMQRIPIIVTMVNDFLDAKP